MPDQRIVFTNPDGTAGVIIPAPGVPMERVMQDIPTSALSARVVPVEAIPTDRLFRAAWRECPDNGVREDFDAALECAHGLRRAARLAEFAPYDQKVAAAIPGEVEAAEAARVAIREKYVVVQAALDAAESVQALRAELSEVL